MAFGTNEKFSSFQDLINGDESPKVAGRPLSQKVIKCDVPDISIISDGASESEIQPRQLRTNHFVLPPNRYGINQFITNPILCDTNLVHAEQVTNTGFPVINNVKSKYENDYELTSRTQVGFYYSPLKNAGASVRRKTNEFQTDNAINEANIKESYNVYHSQKYLHFKKQKEATGILKSLPNDKDLLNCDDVHADYMQPMTSSPLRQNLQYRCSSHDDIDSLNESNMCTYKLKKSKAHNACDLHSTSESDSSLPKLAITCANKITEENNSKRSSKKKCTKKNCKKCLRLKKNDHDIAQISSPDHCAEQKALQVIVPSPEIDSIWEYLKEQDKKLSSIQEQVDEFLSQKSNCCCDSKSPLPLESPGSHKQVSTIAPNTVSLNSDSDVEKRSENIELVRYLKTHSEQMQKLQEQINLLLSRSMGQTELPTRNGALPLENSDDCVQEEQATQQGDDHSISAQNLPANVVCQETQVTKTSTSTMTSVALEGNDKFVFRKMLTVVTDVSKYSKEFSAQYISGQEFTDKHFSTESPSPIKVAVSKKKSAQKKVRNQENLLVSPHTKVKSPNDSNREAVLLDKQAETEKFQNKVPKAGDSKNPLPRYESILQNVNELVVNNLKMNGNDDAKIKRSPKQKQLQSSTPIEINHIADKRKKIRKQKHQDNQNHSNSSSSTDSSYHTPEKRISNDNESHANHCESSTIARYGLSSPNLSVATKQYLENYGLVKNGNSSKKNVRKSLTKRYLS